MALYKIETLRRYKHVFAFFRRGCVFAFWGGVPGIFGSRKFLIPANEGGGHGIIREPVAQASWWHHPALPPTPSRRDRRRDVTAAAVEIRPPSRRCFPRQPARSRPRPRPRPRNVPARTYASRTAAKLTAIAAAARHAAAARLASAAAGAASVAADALAASASDRAVAVATLCCDAHAHAALRLCRVVASRGCARCCVAHADSSVSVERRAFSVAAASSRVHNGHWRASSSAAARTCLGESRAAAASAAAPRAACALTPARDHHARRISATRRGCDVSSSAGRPRGDDGSTPTEPERRAALRRQRRRSGPPRHWPR